MEIELMAQGHPYWEKAIGFAERSAWRAGPYLARMMRANDFLPWERVILAREGDVLLGYCTLTAHDEMPPERGLSPFIGFVYVDPAARGQRISEKMIGRAAAYAASLGYAALYLMSGEKGLYEKYGFAPMGEYDTIFGTRDQLFSRQLG